MAHIFFNQTPQCQSSECHAPWVEGILNCFEIQVYNNLFLEGMVGSVTTNAMIRS